MMTLGVLACWQSA